MLFPDWLSVSRHKTEAIGRLVVVIALSAWAFSSPAQAESEAYVPYSGIVHGTDGAEPVEVSVTNETGDSLDCRAALAHWYSDELGRMDPGGRLTVTLWHDGETGVLNLMNATDDRMPVEAIWCASEDSRARLDLPMKTGEEASKLHFSCQTGESAGLSCVSTDG
ncbi:hypothetical protein [Martelella endophytica]|uniref:Uncharacterized protein n=1 Tax=Martelella endophytica TaxID=1486262 RepID=A0A0D5LMJ8_MAREN|nr:hypothetical protein [Martelella endophytica]AJY44997.1 hypothetical protein TM49_03730 [Martelella endophytica]